MRTQPPTPCSGQPLLVLACLVAQGLLTACNALLHTDRDQCTRDADCTVSPYLVCSGDRVCVPAWLAAEAGAGGAASTSDAKLESAAPSPFPDSVFGAADASAVAAEEHTTSSPPDAAGAGGTPLVSGSADADPRTGSGGAVAANGTGGAATAETAGGSRDASGAGSTSPANGGAGGVAGAGRGGFAAAGGSGPAPSAGGSPTQGAGGGPTGSGGQVGSTGGSVGVGGTTSTSVDPCLTSNVFCDRFELDPLGTAIGNRRWTQWSSDSDLMGATAISKPADRDGRAFYMQIPGTGLEVWTMQKNLEGSEGIGLRSNGTADIQFDFRSRGTPIYPWGIICGGGNYHLTMELGKNLIQEEGDLVPGDNHHASFDDDPLGDQNDFYDWKTIHLILSRGTNHLRVEVEGAKKLDTDLHADLSQSPCIFVIGAYWAKHEPPANWEGWYDNVKITAQ